MFGGCLVSCTSTLALAVAAFRGSNAAYHKHDSDDTVTASVRAFVDRRGNEGEETEYTRFGVLMSVNMLRRS